MGGDKASRWTGWALALLWAGLAPPGLAAEDACAAPAPAVPEPGQCRRQQGLAPGLSSAQALEALFERGVALQHRGDFPAASAALDCAAAVAGPQPPPKIEYELLRRRGVLDYRRECPAQALDGFRRALALAERNQDPAAQAKTWSNIGSALRRLGDYRDALQALLTALRLQRSSGGAGVGATLNNIADVYRDLGQSAEASRHYVQARAEFLRSGDRAEAAHVLATQGVLALDAGQWAQGERLLGQAREELLATGDRRYLPRLYAELGRAAIGRGDLEAARGWTDAGLALFAGEPAALAATTPPAPLQLQAARGERLRGQARAALQRSDEALSRLAPNDSDRPALLAELAADHEALGQWPQALAAQRESAAAERALREARYDREMKWMQLRFQTAERDRTIAALAAANRTRALALWLTVVSALAALLGLTLFFLRRQQRARIAEAARRARLAEEADYHRRAAAELDVDRARLQAALDSREDAVLVLDTAGRVLAANRSAGQLLQPAGGLGGRAFGELLAPDSAAALAQALGRLDESSLAQRLELRSGTDGQRLRARLEEVGSGEGEGLVVLGLALAGPATDEATAAPEAAADPRAAAGPGGPAAEGEAEDARREGFRRALVELMLAVVEAWERSTGQGRLELAEKSRVWRVTVDDGRLRARAMERYLSLAKLPRQPRWRDVLRSAYYVLAECPLEASVRAEVQRHLDAVLAYTRRHALV